LRGWGYCLKVLKYGKTKSILVYFANKYLNEAGVKIGKLLREGKGAIHLKDWRTRQGFLLYLCVNG
jgi:hypothetical protein